MSQQLFKEWEKNAKRKSKENYRYIKRLKVKEVENLEEQLEELHDEVFQEINCLDCGNCCKSFNITLTEEDCERISTYLGKDVFSIIDYVVTPEEKLLINTLPCPFLGLSNECTIYEVRPEVCQEFPHFKGKDIRQRSYLHSENTKTCPATYHILERLKKAVQ